MYNLTLKHKKMDDAMTMERCEKKKKLECTNVLHETLNTQMGIPIFSMEDNT